MQLKSGGPVMTVERISTTGVVTTWFAYGKCQSTNIRAQALQAATAPDQAGK